jgi:iron complex outermembrane receptor protein
LDEGLWAGKIGLNYKPTRDLLLYATINRGVKGGGFNAPSNPSVLTTAQYVFQPEVLVSYEAGFKDTISKNYLLNASTFWYDYSNYQGYKSIGITNFIVNNKARIFGVEADLRAHPLDHLDAILGGSYTDAVVHNVQLAPGLSLERTPAFTPRFQVNGLVRYEIPTALGTVALQADASWRSSYYLQLVNYQDLRQRGYFLTDARVSLTGNNHAGWEVYADARNLTNTTYMVSAFDVSANLGVGDVAYNMPRTFDIGVRYQW